MTWSVEHDFIHVTTKDLFRRTRFFIRHYTLSDLLNTILHTSLHMIWSVEYDFLYLITYILISWIRVFIRHYRRCDPLNMRIYMIWAAEHDLYMLLDIIWSAEHKCICHYTWSELLHTILYVTTNNLICWRRFYGFMYLTTIWPARRWFYIHHYV
jgi:hypothetical protein